MKPGWDRQSIARAAWIALAGIAGVAAVGLRFWWAEQITPRPISDAAWYWNMAKSIAAGTGYSGDGVPTAYRPVGYSAALAPFVSAFGADLIVARMFNAALSVFSLSGLYLVTLKLSGSYVAAFVALCLFGLYPADVGYTSVVLSELLFNALTILALAVVLLRPHAFVTCAIGGTLLGFATLTRPHAGLLVPLVGGALFAWVTPPKRALQLGCVLALACATSMAPWWLRNARVFGAFVPVSTNGGVNLYIGNHPEATGTYAYDKERAARIEARLPAALKDPARELAFDREAARMAFAYMRAEPERTALLWNAKLGHLFMHEGAFSRFSRKLPEEQRPLLRKLGAISLRYYMAFLLLSAAGLAIALIQLVASREARRRALWLPGAFVFAFTVLTLLTFGESRFHHPIMPWLAIYAGHGLGTVAQLPGRVLQLVRSRGT